MMGTRALQQDTQAPRAEGPAPRAGGMVLVAPGSFEPIQAPWIRPGVVVHDPREGVDGLLARFADDLNARGFRITGYVHRPERDGTGPGEGCAERVEVLDLRRRQTLSLERDTAGRVMREALREDADLLIISRFSACLQAMDALGASVGEESSHGMPLLTSIAGQCIHKWHRFAQQEGSMLTPDPRALWRWWGPERLYRDLALGVAEEPVRQIACGPRWIMVEGPRGAGLAYLPRHPRGLMPRLPQLGRWSLRALAGLVSSWDPLEMALGVAALNAHYNHYDLEGDSGNGARLFRKRPGRVVVIGAFPGVDGLLPGCAIIETDPRPGEFPPVAMDTLVPGCGGVLVNASALINRSLPRILRLAQGRPVGLIGPATPLTDRLHAYGVDVLGGMVVTNPQGLAAAVRAGALPRSFGQYGRFIHRVNPDSTLLRHRDQPTPLRPGVSRPILKCRG
ncbi:Rossmann-like domain-containing protein [Pararhodospirillum oryzae]|uniref:Uncharacterized protein n=1 Tax=Pararhodospirillum oryzae TaxID=478448 RepID=A0A512H3P0_9PROT|nr:DUF364 domain-containing protein [Pararhodospirillum oryzae]GEO80018.1 hypothetical protein ROR02_01490 [Pararhodospirillum oryzae]